MVQKGMLETMYTPCVLVKYGKRSGMTEHMHMEQNHKRTHADNNL